MKQLFVDGDPDVRQSAAENSVAVDRLPQSVTELLSDPSSRVRLAAVGAVPENDKQKCRDLLLPLAEDEDRRVRDLVSIRLRSLG